MQDILFGTVSLLILISLLVLLTWCISFRNPDPLAMVIGDRFYPSDDPRLGHPLAARGASPGS